MDYGNDLGGMHIDQQGEAISFAWEKYLAMLMLDGSNREWFAKMKAGVDLDYAKGKNMHPSMLRLLHSKNTTAMRKMYVPK